MKAMYAKLEGTQSFQTKAAARAQGVKSQRQHAARLSGTGAA
jgi:hypothetical protein